MFSLPTANRPVSCLLTIPPQKILHTLLRWHHKNKASRSQPFPSFLLPLPAFSFLFPTKGKGNNPFPFPLSLPQFFIFANCEQALGMIQLSQILNIVVKQDKTNSFDPAGSMLIIYCECYSGASINMWLPSALILSQLHRVIVSEKIIRFLLV